MSPQDRQPKLKLAEMKTYSVNNKEVTIDFLTNWIKERIDMVNNGHPSQYLVVKIEDENGDYYACADVKLRVSDHSAKKTNNSDSEYTLSFVTDTCDQGYMGMVNEWVVEDTDSMFTSTHEYVSDILEWEMNENVKLEEY